MSTTEELIEEYQNTLDHMRICEHDGDECEADDANCRLTDIAKELVERKPKVSADVKWHNGRVTATEGTLTAIRGDKVYLSCEIGNVEGSVESLTSA